jgi:hypothetical protein
MRILHLATSRAAHYTCRMLLADLRVHLGAIAQLGERLDRTQEVAGSSPASSTILMKVEPAQFPERGLGLRRFRGGPTP